MRPYWRLLGIMLLLTPLGLLAEGTAWGEWGVEELEQFLGFTPAGIMQAQTWWQAVMPDYEVIALGAGQPAHTLGYLTSAVVGTVLVYVGTRLYTRLLGK